MGSTTVAWRDWYHCIVTTYGTWLRGDPRGWRSRHHREHVEGDYKCPPAPGAYDKLHAYSQRLMKRAPVYLPSRLHQPVLDQFVLRLRQEELLVAIASLDGHHLHVLAQFPDKQPRVWVGVAKMHTSRWLRDHGEPGGIWAVRSKPKPIRDRQHQINVYRYILAHRDDGAALCQFTQKQSYGKT